MSHTPIPWVVDPDDRIGMEWNTHITVADDPNHRVCFMTSGPEGPVNAAFIVRAVNNYDLMLIELKRLLEQFGHQATADVIAAAESAP